MSHKKSPAAYRMMFKINDSDRVFPILKSATRITQQVKQAFNPKKDPVAKR